MAKRPKKKPIGKARVPDKLGRGHSSKIPSVDEINRLVRRREVEEETLMRLRLLRVQRQGSHAYEHLRGVPEGVHLREPEKRRGKKTPEGERVKRDIAHLDDETSEDIRRLEKARLPTAEEIKRLAQVRKVLFEEESRIRQMETGILPGKGKKAIYLNKQQKAWLHRRESYISGQIRKIDAFLERLPRPKGVQKKQGKGALKKAA